MSIKNACATALLLTLSMTWSELGRAHDLPNDPGGHIHVSGIAPPCDCGAWVRGGGNSGESTDPSGYGYHQPSPLGIPGAAASKDHHWVHVYPGTELVVWDLGFEAQSVIVFPTIDHGPVPEEAFEFTVYGSNDLSVPETGWEVGDIQTVFDQGWDASWISDDYASEWAFTQPYRYIGILWGGERAALADGDAEIDAVCANAPTPLKRKTWGALKVLHRY